MVVTMNELLSFRMFYEEVKDESLPIRTAYKFTKLFNKIDEELNFYQEQIQKLSQEYGEVDKDGNLIPLEDGMSIKIKPNKIVECQQKVDELLNLEVEVGDFSFTMDELDGLSLSIANMRAISKFICE